jgi:hypothetical protein
MAGKFPSRGEFTIPEELYDEHEWCVDGMIASFGNNCQLVYPPKDTQCDNCKIDPISGRSTDIYNGTGPIPFNDFSLCPKCNGSGRLLDSQTEIIKLRVYWNPKNWISIGTTIQIPDGSVQVIGYLTDLPKLERAKEIILNSDTSAIKTLRTVLQGEPQLWGFRQTRYFVAFLKRI